jgi:uncharacterized protein (DUF305 family)
MQNKNIVIGVLALIVALGAGYVVGASANRYDNDDYNRGGMHMMPDGSMMGNNGGSSMQGMMMDMNAALVGKTGDAFDRVFLSEMIVHHQGAVEMAELALTNAKHQEIKDLATGIIAAQNKEIADMQAWEKAWYGR